MISDLMKEFQNKRVAIYARVSTEHEAQLSALENQIDWYKPILEAHKEWTLACPPYVDEGITGTSAEKRPRFMEMMRDAKKHKFDMIITREVSRFARNTVDTLQYTRMLKSIGVEVFFINDNIKTFDGDGELRLTIMATLAQDESRKTSIRAKAGQQTSMNNGVYFGTGNILGYDRVGKDMVINEEQAKTVRMIYDMYLNGYGILKIKYELERLGRLTSQGKTNWFCTTISHVLSNTFYSGIIQYHKEYVSDFLEQKKVKNRGEIEYTYVKGRHTPIVTVEEFRRVQEIKASRTGESKEEGKYGKKYNGNAPAKYAFTRLLVCQCGKKLNCHQWNRKNCKPSRGYICYSQTNYGTLQTRENHKLSSNSICKVPMVPEWKLDLMAYYIFRDYITDSEKVISLAYQMLEQHIADDDDSQKISRNIQSNEKEIKKLKSKLDNFIDMRAEGEITKEEYQEKTSDLKERIQKLSAANEELTLSKVKDSNRDYKAELAALKTDLEKIVDFECPLKVPDNIVEAFIEKIVVHENSFDWYLRIPRDKKTFNGTEELDAKTIFESIDDIISTSNVESALGLSANDKDKKIQIASFSLSLKDAKDYQYAISTKNRIYKWQDITVNVLV